MRKTRDDAGPRDQTMTPGGAPTVELIGTPAPRSWRAFDPASLEGKARELATELTTYRDRLDEILEHEGEYVVIKGDRIIGYYPVVKEAWQAAREFAPGPCLVKRVVEFEPIVQLGGVCR